MKYIDSEKLIAEIKRLDEKYRTIRVNGKLQEAREADLVIKVLRNLSITITSLQQEQPDGKQVIIITETDGDANIDWDCRSLDDVMALLTSAQSFIADKQVEELRGPGSGPDYNTEEGRYSSLFKHRQEQPEVGLEKEITPSLVENMLYEFGVQSIDDMDSKNLAEFARHFYELGLNARKEE